MQRKIEVDATTHRSWPLIVMPIICVVLLGAAIFTLPRINLSSGSSQATKSLLTDAHIPLVGLAQKNSAPQMLAQNYMTALLKGQYRTMWSLLSPRIQNTWPDEASYAAFWQARYHDYILQSFSVGSTSRLARWVDSETMVAYTNVEEMPVSLQLRPDATLSRQSLLPPQDLHPEAVLKNLPFIIQQVPTPKTVKPLWQVLAGGPADPEAPILPPVHPTNKLIQVPILMYHHISPVATTNLLEWSLTVTPALFKQQLDYLQQQGYHTITFNQLFDALYFGAPLPTRPIILTFDDGYDDVYTFAMPLLKQHGFSGMFYIISGKVGWVGYMNWGQLHTLLANGMQIGSHTIHHVDMGQTFLYSKALAQQELQLSKAKLEKQLGIVIQQFCYPSGEPFRSESLYLQQQIVALLATDGYVGATTDPGQTGIYQHSLAPFDLLRIRVDGRETFNEFVFNLPWQRSDQTGG